jgi:hypothetical protein
MSSDLAGRASAARLFVYLAREAPIGVVLRRGPSAWARLSLWHTDTDAFEHGQWFRGRVYERRSDLSADGRLFVYFARRSGGRAPNDLADSWIAVSRPPWFTALALWAVGGTYCLGGFFPGHRPRASRSLWLGWDRPPDLGRLPAWLRVTTDPPPHVDRTNNWTERTVYLSRLLRDGWTPVPGARPETWQRPHPSGQLSLVMTQVGFEYRAAGGPYLVDYAVRYEPSGGTLPLGRASWADWDQGGRLIIARDGRLLHWQPPEVLHEIADLNPQTPSPAAPARARAWPAGRRR